MSVEVAGGRSVEVAGGRSNEVTGAGPPMAGRTAVAGGGETAVLFAPAGASWDCVYSVHTDPSHQRSRPGTP
jgi:hypothetical protein